MCIGTRLSVSLAASDKRCVITGKLLHCLRAAEGALLVDIRSVDARLFPF